MPELPLDTFPDSPADAPRHPRGTPTAATGKPSTPTHKNRSRQGKDIHEDRRRRPNQTERHTNKRPMRARASVVTPIIGIHRPGRPATAGSPPVTSCGGASPLFGLTPDCVRSGRADTRDDRRPPPTGADPFPSSPHNPAPRAEGHRGTRWDGAGSGSATAGITHEVNTARAVPRVRATLTLRWAGRRRHTTSAPPLPATDARRPPPERRRR